MIVTEIGAFLNVHPIPVEAPGSQPARVEIRPSVAGAPSLTTVLASFVLTHDADYMQFSYEYALPGLILPPGEYYALFAPQGDNSGGILTEHSVVLYSAGVVDLGEVHPGIFTTSYSGKAAVRILAEPIPEPSMSALRGIGISLLVWLGSRRPGNVAKS